MKGFIPGIPLRDNLSYSVAAMVTRILSIGLLAIIAVADTSADATFAGRNGKIAATVYGFERGAFGRIYTMSPNGADLTALTGPQLEAESPAWAPDGRRIAFVGGRANRGESAIYVMKADGSGKRRLTYGGAAKSSPTWSPDGRRIAFLACRPSCGHVYVVSAYGKPGHGSRASGFRVRWVGARPLHTIAWSPRGRRIAYDAEDRGILLAKLRPRTKRRHGKSAPLRLAVTEPTELVLGESQGPAWSPDGKSLSFQRFAGVAPGLYSIDVRSANRGRITRGHDDSAVAPSPDGRRVVFARGEALFVADVNGTRPVRVTSGPLLYGAADWQPLPGR